MIMITQQQIDSFEQDGFLVVKGMYNEDEIREICNWTEEVTNYPEIPGKYMMYFEQSQLEGKTRILSRLEDFEPYHAGFSQLFSGEKMKGNISQLFGEEAVLYKDKINFKMPGGDGFKAHQDVQAGWDRYSKIHITVLVSIDASNLENGCLEMAVAQHKSGLIGEKWQPLEEDALDYIAIPAEPGDAIFFDSFAPHRSEPNLTDKARRVLYVTYNKLSEGDHRRQYYIDKRANYPPDCERDADKEYVFRV